MTPLSASQVKLSFDCMARWGARYLEGHREPETPATELGKEIHRQLEEWTLHAKMPTHKVALAGLPYARLKGTGAEVEVALAFSTPSSTWRGYVDVRYSPAFREIVIQDWKTTSNIDYAKTPEYLANEDTQAMLYAYQAFSTGCYNTVHGKWVYLTTKGAARALPVDFIFERQKVVDFIEGPVDKQASKLQQLYQIRPKWTDLEKNTSFCYAFGRQCPHFDECQPHTSISMPKGDPMSNGFKESIAASFPSAPPLPGVWKPGDPLNTVQEMLTASGKPLWLIASAADNPPPTEVAKTYDAPAAPRLQPSQLEGTEGYRHAFVNPPEAPKTPSATPEASLERQGGAPPPPPTPPLPEAVDELDGMTRDQIKAIAVSLGVVAENTRMRETALKEAVRSYREEEVGCGIPVSPAVMLEALVDLKERMAAPPAPPPPPVPVVGDGPYDADVKPDFQPFTLCVDCAPCWHTDQIVIGLDVLVHEAHAVLRKEHPELKDYRQIPYTAVGSLCVAAEEAFRSGKVGSPDVIVLSTRTPEGSALVTMLEGLASEVIRGF